MSFCPAVNDSRSFHLSHLLIWLPSSTFAYTLHSLYDEKFLPLLVLLHLHPHSFPTRLPLPTSSSSSATSPTFSPLPPSRTLFLCLSVCRPTYILIVLFDLRVLFLLFLCPYDRIYRLFHTRVGYSNARSMPVSLFLFMYLLFYLRVLFHLFLPPSACTWRLLPWYRLRALTAACVPISHPTTGAQCIKWPLESSSIQWTRTVRCIISRPLLCLSNRRSCRQRSFSSGHPVDDRAHRSQLLLLLLLVEVLFV